MIKKTQNLVRNLERTNNGSDPQLILTSVNPFTSVKWCPFTAAKDLIFVDYFATKIILF